MLIKSEKKINLFKEIIKINVKYFYLFRILILLKY